MLLRVENVAKGYEANGTRTEVLRGVGLTLGAGTSLAMTGESGSGKSTLLHLIGGLDTPDSGAIYVDDIDIGALDDAGRAKLRRDKISVVFQQFNLIPSLNVAANIAFQARLAGRFDRDWSTHLIETLGLAALTKRYPEELSGGQQQRVATARALAGRPKLVLADEPTGNLDQATGDTVMDLLMGLVRDTGASLLMVTHSDRLAQRLDRQIFLRDGQLA